MHTHLLYLLEEDIERLGAESMTDGKRDDQLHQLMKREEEPVLVLKARVAEGPVDGELHPGVEERGEGEADEHAVFCVGGRGHGIDAEGAQGEELGLEDAEIVEDGPEEEEHTVPCGQ